MWMIEGEWSGYTCSQQRVMHREYVTKTKRGRAFIEKVKALGYGIRYTDGTMLILRVSEVPKRALPTIDGYTSLIRDCAEAGISSVSDLPCRYT